MKMSIRSTLLMLLFLVLVLAILINSVLGHMLVRQEVNEVFDAELAVTTKLIKGLLEDDDLMEDLPRIVEALNQSLDHKQPDQPELELYENTRLPPAAILLVYGVTELVASYPPSGGAGGCRADGSAPDRIQWLPAQSGYRESGPRYLILQKCHPAHK